MAGKSDNYYVLDIPECCRSNTIAMEDVYSKFISTKILHDNLEKSHNELKSIHDDLKHYSSKLEDNYLDLQKSYDELKSKVDEFEKDCKIDDFNPFVLNDKCKKYKKESKGLRRALILISKHVSKCQGRQYLKDGEIAYCP